MKVVAIEWLRSTPPTQVPRRQRSPNNLDGATLNMPNDLDLDGQGRIYFSDPNYSAEPNNLPHESVYLAAHTFGGNWTTKRVTFDTNRPNGVLLSADQSILYVAESPVNKSFADSFGRIRSCRMGRWATARCYSISARVAGSMGWR